MVAALQGYLSADHAKVARTENPEVERLKEACRSFEGFFLHKMMQTMRQATMESGLIKKSNGEKIFTDMLDEQLTDEAAKASVNGMADMIYDSISWTLGAEGGIQTTASEMARELSGLRTASREDSFMENKALPLF